MNPIKFYEVRVAGCDAWMSGIDDEEQAHIEASCASNETGYQHKVYAIHVNGDMTGPYERVTR